MSKNASARPNRVVTCQTCGVQMPQRYLAGHMKEHEQATAEASPSAPEKTPEDAPDQQPEDNAAPGSQPAGMLICPACAEFIAEGDFTDHMQARHTNWCPLCHAQTKDLAGHLSSRHRLKPIQPPPLYERSWQTQKRFICLGCKKKVSVWSYPKHEGPHGATRGLAQRAGKARPPRPPLHPAPVVGAPTAGRRPGGDRERAEGGMKNVKNQERNQKNEKRQSTPGSIQNRALSVRQPYAEQILRGTKKIEYRSKPTQIRGRVYLYASLTPATHAFEKMGAQPGDFPTGVIVGTVEVAGCTGFGDEYEWHLARPERLAEPIKPERHPQPAWFKPFVEEL